MIKIFRGGYFVLYEIEESLHDMTELKNNTNLKLQKGGV